jgi:hypothetical protein
MNNAARASLDAKYDLARASYAAVSGAYTVATKAYRSKAIGDAEFLAARNALNVALAALAALDAAEAEYVEAVNLLPAEVEAVDDSQVSLF